DRVLWLGMDLETKVDVLLRACAGDPLRIDARELHALVRVDVLGDEAEWAGVAGVGVAGSVVGVYADDLVVVVGVDLEPGGFRDLIDGLPERGLVELEGELPLAANGAGDPAT